MYTTIHHNLLIKVLSEIIHTVLESKVCSKIGFSAISIYCTSEKILTEAITFLIKNCYFIIGNMVFKQKFGIPMGIDPATFWANRFVYFFKSKHVQNLISKKLPRA